MKLTDAIAKVRNAGFDTRIEGHGVLIARLNRPISIMEVKMALYPNSLDDDGIEFDRYSSREVAITGLDLTGWERPEFPYGEFQDGAQWNDPNYYDRM